MPEDKGDLPPNVVAKWKEALSMGAGTSIFAGNRNLHFLVLMVCLQAPVTGCLPSPVEERVLRRRRSSRNTSSRKRARTLARSCCLNDASVLLNILFCVHFYDPFSMMSISFEYTKNKHRWVVNPDQSFFGQKKDLIAYFILELLVWLYFQNASCKN